VALLAIALSGVGGCAGASTSGPGASPAGRGQPIVYDFPAAGDDVVVNSDSMRGRPTVLIFITTFDLASQLLARRLGEIVVAFTPRVNAAAVTMEPPRYAELLPAYREAMALPYPVVMADYATQQGAGPFGSITFVPTIVVLDREGREVLRREGGVERSQIEAALRRAAGLGR